MLCIENHSEVITLMIFLQDLKSPMQKGRTPVNPQAPSFAEHFQTLLNSFDTALEIRRSAQNLVVTVPVCSGFPRLLSRVRLMSFTQLTHPSNWFVHLKMKSCPSTQQKSGLQTISASLPLLGHFRFSSFIYLHFNSLKR